MEYKIQNPIVTEQEFQDLLNFGFFNGITGGSCSTTHGYYTNLTTGKQTISRPTKEECEHCSRLRVLMKMYGEYLLTIND